MVIIYQCDNCDLPIHEGIYKRADGDGDYCSRACAEQVRLAADEGCKHVNNADGTTHSTAEGFRRLVCNDCGYDREEAA